MAADMEYRFLFIGSRYNHYDKSAIMTDWGKDGWVFTGYTEPDESGTQYLMQREEAQG